MVINFKSVLTDTQKHFAINPIFPILVTLFIDHSLQIMFRLFREQVVISDYISIMYTINIIGYSKKYYILQIIILTLCLYYFLSKYRPLIKGDMINAGIGISSGGAISNTMSNFFHGNVVDYLVFQNSFFYLATNLADIFILTGSLLLTWGFARDIFLKLSILYNERTKSKNPGG